MDEYLDVYQKLTTPKDGEDLESMSSMLNMLAKLKAFFTKIFNDGFEKGYMKGYEKGVEVKNIMKQN